MNVYLAGYNYKKHIFEREMKIYIALGNEAAGYVFKNKTEEELLDIHLVDSGRAGCKEVIKDKIHVLESFYYIRDWMIPYIQNHWNFLLDSGAFTFIEQKSKGDINFEDYLYKYIEFINKNDIELFFELDIDSVVGLKEVERLRVILEKETGKKSIPVWHKSRGLDYYKDMCKEWNYVAIGGIVSREIIPKDYPVFTNLINIAKKQNTKVHGLGFTNPEGLKKYKFDSVDSTAWTYGNRGGFLYKFTGDGLIKYKSQKNNTRLKSKEAAIHNFKEWVKFQKYAEKNL